MLPRLALLLAVSLSLVSCLSYTSVYQKRGTEPPFPEPGTMTVAEFEASQEAQLDAEARSVERFKDFEIGVLEITDDGLVNPAQKEQVFSMVRQDLAKENEMLMVVFAHGWHHGPHVCDRDLACFRRVMERLATSKELKARKAIVTGVYLGWRGESIRSKPWNNVSFWDRKNTAQHVGRTGGKEILLELDALYAAAKHNGKTVTMVTVGHSFGGALVFSAMKGLATGDAAGIIKDTTLEQTYRVVRAEGNRVDATKTGVKAKRARLGDLVVLVNPAIEADQYKPFHADLPKSDIGKYRPPPDKDKPYDQSQLPVLLAIASTADKAVGMAFPAGRWLMALTDFDIALDPSKRAGMGHYEPHITHKLTYPEKEFAETKEQCGCPKNFDAPVNISDKPLNLHTTEVQDFGDLELTPQRPATWDKHSPYLVVQTNAGVMREHSDIYNPVFVEFLTKFIRAYYARSVQVQNAAK
jgi:hypothetical protein